MPTKNLAKRAVALKLCQCLHEAGNILYIYHQSENIQCENSSLNQNELNYMYSDQCF